MILWLLVATSLFAQYREDCPDPHGPPPKPIAGILVVHPTIFPLQVRMQPDPQVPARPLAHCREFLWREFTEEEPPGLLVLQRRGSWFQIALTVGSGWVQMTRQHRYLPMTELIKDGAWLTAGWNARLSAAPRTPATIPLPKPDAKEKQSDVFLQILDRQTLSGTTWLHIEAYSQYEPYEESTRRNLARGWVPIFAAWYHSRD